MSRIEAAFEDSDTRLHCPGVNAVANWRSMKKMPNTTRRKHVKYREADKAKAALAPPPTPASTGNKTPLQVIVTDPKTGEQMTFNISRSLHAFVGLPEECTQLGQMILVQLAELMKPGSADASLVHSVQGMVALEPKDAMQSLLACQMLGVHTAAFTFLRRATVNDQTIDGVDRNVNRAVRLMKLFNNQAELMLKLKGKSGQQKVTVEHVNVAPGGQAIVGLVTAPGGGSKNES
jgi:hypothetical protein